MALELKDIPEPIGKWLIENSKKNFPTESGTYYHYVEVCRLLQLMKDECVGKESSDELGNCNKPHVINCVPYQLCPKCGGDGNLLRYNSPNLLGMTVPICDVCEGKKIIPMAHCL